MSAWKDRRIAAVLGWSVLVVSALIWVAHSAANAESGEAIAGMSGGALAWADLDSRVYLACGSCGRHFHASRRNMMLAQSPGSQTAGAADSKSVAQTPNASMSSSDAAPEAFSDCKTCHGDDARGRGSIGPDLTLSELTLDQWIMQTRFGSKWDGKPPKRKGFEKRIMTEQIVTDEEVKEIYEWAKGSR